MASKTWQNKSGCPDPTAYAVEKPISEEQKRADIQIGRTDRRYA
jgi:hypothetical protein